MIMACRHFFGVWLVILSSCSDIQCLSIPTGRFHPEPNWRTEYDADRDAIVLNCLAEGNPQILWTITDQTVVDERVEIVNNNMTLKIFDPKPEDSGWYKCSLRVDGVERDSYAREITVSARPSTKPRVIAWEPESTRKDVAVGGSANLSCTFDGGSLSNPIFQSSLIWQRNGTELEDTEKYTYGISAGNSEDQSTGTLYLTVNNITQEDLGAYECVIHNTLGNDSKSLFLQLPDSKGRGPSLTLWMYIAMGAGGFVVLTFVAVVFVYKLRRKKEEVEWLKPDMDNFDVPDNKISYDVFISYSSDDELWVKNELFFYLEQNGYKVNIDFKDFVPGMAIAENVMDSIYKSRKTIVVMSKNFLKSMWGQFELQQAHNRAIAQRQDILILIKYGKCKVPCKLMGKTFLDWTDQDVKPHFWMRLTEAIGNPGNYPEIQDKYEEAILKDKQDEEELINPEKGDQDVLDKEEVEITQSNETQRTTSDYESDFTEVSDEVFMESPNRLADWKNGAHHNPLINTRSEAKRCRISTESNSRCSCDDETQHLLC